MNTMEMIAFPAGSLSPTFVPPAPVVNTVTKEELEKALENVQKKLEKLEKDVLSKNEHSLSAHLRINRPLKWKCKWNGEKKYATLGKERLEVWQARWKEWYPVSSYEGASTEVRMPN